MTASPAAPIFPLSELADLSAYYVTEHEWLNYTSTYYVLARQHTPVLAVHHRSEVRSAETLRSVFLRPPTLCCGTARCFVLTGETSGEVAVEKCNGCLGASKVRQSMPDDFVYAPQALISQGDTWLWRQDSTWKDEVGYWLPEDPLSAVLTLQTMEAAVEKLIQEEHGL